VLGFPSSGSFIGILFEVLGFFMPFHSTKNASLSGTTIASIAPFTFSGMTTF
jgi:hypothetical protein